MGSTLHAADEGASQIFKNVTVDIDGTASAVCISEHPPSIRTSVTLPDTGLFVLTQFRQSVDGWACKFIPHPTWEMIGDTAAFDGTLSECATQTPGLNLADDVRDSEQVEDAFHELVGSAITVHEKDVRSIDVAIDSLLRCECERDDGIWSIRLAIARIGTRDGY